MADSILSHFAQLPDPRRDEGKRHQLTDLIAIAICGVICGADDWTEIEDFGNAKLEWFRTFLELPHGIASHDTFGRVFAVLDPDAFERCFMAWTASLAEASEGQLIAIDGKAIRRSFQRGWNKHGAIHLVSAFSAANSMVFGQLAVEVKSNEIVAIPKLLELLDLSGKVVTIDAMGCQKEIAEKIVASGADYVLAVKDHQPALHEKTTALMTEAALDHVKSGKGCSDGSDGAVRYGFAETVEKDHGRIETRRIWVSDEVEALGTSLLQDWKGLGSVVRVQSRRDIDGKVSVETRVYISSIQGRDAGRMGQVVRGHWSVENQLHWQLDVSFREDQSRVRSGHAAENLSRIRRISLNLLKRDRTKKRGIKGKRLNAAWDHDYLLHLLTG
jgi:predicted transposase YbfD/YdcC